VINCADAILQMISNKAAAHKALKPFKEWWNFLIGVMINNKINASG
jgi:hypothetical protein